MDELSGSERSVHGDLAQRGRIFVLQELRAWTGHALSSKRSAAGSARTLRLSARQRLGRLLVGLVAARWQGPVEGQVRDATRAFLFEVLLRLPGLEGRADTLYSGGRRRRVVGREDSQYGDEAARHQRVWLLRVFISSH